MEGKVFKKKVINDAIKLKLPLAIDIAARMGIPPPDPTNPKDCFSPDYETTEPKKGLF